jgi:hypothetical protein
MANIIYLAEAICLGLVNRHATSQRLPLSALAQFLVPDCLMAAIQYTAIGLYSSPVSNTTTVCNIAF